MIRVREYWGGYPWVFTYYSWASWRAKPTHFSLLVTFDGESDQWISSIEPLGPDGMD